MPGVSRGFNFLGMLNNCRPLALKNVLSCQLCKSHLNALIMEVDRPLANFVCRLNTGDKHP